VENPLTGRDEGPAVRVIPARTELHRALFASPDKYSLLAFFACLFFSEWYLFFRNPGHFFQADAVFVLYDRPSSFTDFLSSFIKLDQSGWYRPLSLEFPAFILYPWFGLNPVGYRLVVYMVFVALTIAVYVLGVALTKRRTAAAVGTFFFAIHTTNAFTTYDIAFAPELLYGGFYVLAALAFLRFCQTHSRYAYCVSLACLVGSLLSKEAAATLPALLFLLHLLFAPPYSDFRSRVNRALRSTAPHFIVVVVYAVFVLGYLRVQGLDLGELLDRPRHTQEGGYHFVVDHGIFDNMDLAATWAFNIPRGWHGDFRHVPQGWMFSLKLFRVFAAALTLVLCFTPYRRVVLFGLAWFVISLSPTLPLVNHFMPYYLFLPLVGFSFVIGASACWFGDQLRRVHRSIPSVALALTFGPMFWVCAISVQADMRDHRALGGSSELARKTLHDVQNLYPDLPRNVLLYIDDSEYPFAWDHAWGGLIHMVYDRRDIDVRYASNGDLPDLTKASNTVALRYIDGSLVDETPAFRKDPTAYVPFVDSDLYRLSVERPDVTISDSFAVTVTGVHDRVVKIAYRVDGGTIEAFSTYMDSSGRALFSISPQTRKGSYKFVGFHIDGQRGWIRAESAITVH
jgi:hypothetical protein